MTLSPTTDQQPHPSVRTARRLLAASTKSSYDPLTDIDWSAPVAEGVAYLPFNRCSLYGTSEWVQLTEQQHLELSKHELASIAGTGLWFEVLLMQMLLRHVFSHDVQDPRIQYALTEVGDETRHVIMFARAIERMGVPTYRPPRFIDLAAKIYKSLASGPMLFAPVLVAEEMTDRLQRESMNDETIDPIVRQVNRIHVIEESRHVRYAREEVARVFPTLGPVERRWHQLVTALVAAGVASVLYNPHAYKAVGIRPRDGYRAARRNPQHRQTKAWMAEKTMAFLEEQGLVAGFTRPIYRLAHLL